MKSPKRELTAAFIGLGIAQASPFQRSCVMSSMSRILLYEHPLSPYAQKIRVLLREKELPFEARLPQRLERSGGNPELAELNPRLEVPALVHDGLTIFDSTIILEYLEEAFPSPPMMPQSPPARARLRMIEEVCDTHWEAINWGLRRRTGRNPARSSAPGCSWTGRASTPRRGRSRWRAREWG